MVLGIVQSSSPLEVPPPRDKFAHCHIGRSQRPMGEAERRRVAVPFRFSEKLRRCHLLHGDLATHVVASPYPVKYGELLCVVRRLSDEFFRPQKSFHRFRCSVAPARDHRLSKHYLQFQRDLVVFQIVG